MKVGMKQYDYNVMPGEKWLRDFPDYTYDSFVDAKKNAKTMYKAGVRDIVINVYDLMADELADFYYKVDDTTGKVVRK